LSSLLNGVKVGAFARYSVKLITGTAGKYMTLLPLTCIMLPVRANWCDDSDVPSDMIEFFG